MVTKYVKRKTMTDLFQEAFSATDMDVTALPMRSTGYSNPDNYLPIDNSNISGCAAYFLFLFLCAELVIMEGCNRFCRWRKIGTLSSQDSVARRQTI
jgi:hypothetical protein